MQGLESLNQFQNFMSSVGGLGRFEDTYMVHAAEGETVVPMEVLDNNPLLKERLFESMRDMGIEPERYIVGNEFNSLNPVTGQPEFFLKKIVSQIRKAMPGDSEKYLGAAVGALTGNPFYGALAGGVGSGASGALTGGLSGAALPGFSKFGGQAGGFTDYLRGMDPSKLFQKAGGTLMNAYGNFADKGDGIMGLIGRGYEGGQKLLLGEGKDKGFLKKAWESISSGGGSMTQKEILKGVMDGSIDADEAEVLLEKAGGGNKLLKGLLGIGGTLGLGKLIGDPEDITVDRSKLMTSPIDTGQVFSPTQPTTVDTGYNIPITPYQAAEGGIIGYNEGGFSGSPHTSGPMYTGEDEGDVMPKGVQDELLRYLLQKYMQEQEHMRERMNDPYNQYTDPNAPIEVARGGVMDLQGGGFSQGPGTGTSDSIPAMLSDGEFVMTADAVRGAGGGNRREGARKMYEMMDGLEARA